MDTQLQFERMLKFDWALDKMTSLLVIFSLVIVGIAVLGIVSFVKGKRRMKRGSW